MKPLRIVLCIIALVFGLFAQAPPQPEPTPASGGIWSAVSDPDYITTVAAAAASLSNTAVQLTLAGKTYSITPQQQLVIALGSVGTAAVIRHFYGSDHPKVAKVINVGLSIGAVWLGSRAYANTYYRAASPGAIAAGPVQAQFRIPLR